MMLFDTHAHYDDKAFDQDRDTLLKSMAENGVELIVNPGCTVESSHQAVSFAKKYPFMYAAVGIHPENCHDFDETQIDALRQLAQNPKVVAIGEIGLDYYWDENPPKEIQTKCFRAQLQLARQLKLPVIIHDREAHGDCLDIIREFPDVKAVFHCYSGSVEMAKQLLDMGHYLSFTGVVTYKNAKKAPDVVAITPHDRLMIETDAPYLAPVPMRGKRNDSRLVRHVAEKVAEIWGMDYEQIVQTTLQNGKTFFGIK